MQFRPALFAEVLIGKVLFIDQPHAATVLPNFAEVALNKEVAEIVTEGIQDCVMSI